jgi:hypothetical protein
MRDNRKTHRREWCPFPPGPACCDALSGHHALPCPPEPSYPEQQTIGGRTAKRDIIYARSTAQTYGRRRKKDITRRRHYPRGSVAFLLFEARQAHYLPGFVVFGGSGGSPAAWVLLRCRSDGTGTLIWLPQLRRGSRTWDVVFATVWNTILSVIGAALGSGREPVPQTPLCGNGVKQDGSARLPRALWCAPLKCARSLTVLVDTGTKGLTYLIMAMAGRGQA